MLTSLKRIGVGLAFLLVAAIAGSLGPRVLPAIAQFAGTPGLLISGLGTAPWSVLTMASGYIAVGGGAGVNPSAVAVSGDATLTAGGMLTVTKTNGVGFGSAATATIGTSGADVPLLNAANTFSSLQSFAGHVASAGSTPTLSSCGTSPAIVGDDKDGQVAMGTGSPTGCTITFATAYTSAPLCAVSWQATPLASQSYSVSATAIALTQTGTSSNKVNYHCAAQNGG
jgi:hypothetical protein